MNIANQLFTIGVFAVLVGAVVVCVVDFRRIKRSKGR